MGRSSYDLSHPNAAKEKVEKSKGAQRPKRVSYFDKNKKGL
jgi:hypothetical protein